VFNPVSEMQKLRCVIGDLQDELSALKEANNIIVKEKIDAQNCAEEVHKHLKESTV
jgi:FtsZ-binding cell division protein ZapB